MKESKAQKAFNILKKHLTYGDFKELESIISIYCVVAYQKSRKGGENIVSKTIICIGGRCSTWGTSWKKHLYYADIEDGETCVRCGMYRKEQWEEDKYSGLVTGEYKKPKLKRLSYDPEKHRGEQ